MRKKKLLVLLSLGLMLLAMVPGQLVFADVEFKELPNVLDKASLGFDLHLFYRFDNNPYFGVDIPGDDSNDSNFGEILSKLRFTAEKNVDWTTLEAQFAPVYLSTIDQDVYGLAKDTSDLDVDQAWLKFNKLFNGPIDLTMGRQDIEIEKQFLIGIGQAQKSANWLVFNKSFPFGVRLDGDFGCLRTNVFWARSNDYWQKFDEGSKDDVEVAGINLHYNITENAYVYGGYYRKIDNSDLLIPGYSPGGQDLLAENQTNAWDIGFDIPFGGLQLEAEFVYQTGDAGILGGIERDRDAFGGFGSIAYRFPVALSPFIRGTYIYFSGDEDLEDADADDYDPMFYGFGDWNRWVVGELTGEIHLPNSNKKVIIAEAGFSPVPTMDVKLMYLNHKLDENHWLNYATTSDKWADEVNLLTDYQVNDHLLAHLGLGYVEPDDAAKEIFGDDQEAVFAQLWLSFSY